MHIIHGKSNDEKSHAMWQRARALRHDMTEPERKLWYQYLSKHSFRFMRQRVIGPYIADFYCAKAKLVIEIDGESHFSIKGKAYDQNRTQALHEFNLQVLRFTNQEVMHNFEGVCWKIESVLRSPRTSFDPLDPKGLFQLPWIKGAGA